MMNKGLVKSDRSLFPAIASLLDDFFGRNWLDSTMVDWGTFNSAMPAVNIQETNDDFVIEVAAPGLKRDDFKIELDNHVLTISSQREESHEEDGNYTRREFSYHSFQRSFTLPQNRVKGEAIKAQYIDGILRIMVPKTEDAKAKLVKQIAVA